jgi:hypothetical protein
MRCPNPGAVRRARRPTHLGAAACKLAAITRVETRIAAVRGIAREERTGNATQYQASVFNFAPTLKSIYLNLDLDAPPCRLG